MTRVYLPKDKIKTGGSLNSIANDIQLVANINGKISENGWSVFEVDNQELLEDVLTHDNIMTIIAEGGEITGYIMYAAMPYELNSEIIYNCEVPEGLQFRTIKITDGTQVITAVKKLGQWCNASLQQTFSTDYQTIYVNTNPLGDWLKGSELKLFVDGFNAELLTVAEYKALTIVTE